MAFIKLFILVILYVVNNSITAFWFLSYCMTSAKVSTFAEICKKTMSNLLSKRIFAWKQVSLSQLSDCNTMRLMWHLFFANCNSKKSETYLDDSFYVLVCPIAVLAYPDSMLAVLATGYSYLGAGLVVLASCDGCYKYPRRPSNIFLMAVKNSGKRLFRGQIQLKLTFILIYCKEKGTNW